jgi:hypothetical protein
LEFSKFVVFSIYLSLSLSLSLYVPIWTHFLQAHLLLLHYMLVPAFNLQFGFTLPGLQQQIVLVQLLCIGIIIMILCDFVVVEESKTRTRTKIGR